MRDSSAISRKYIIESDRSYYDAIGCVQCPHSSWVRITKVVFADRGGAWDAKNFWSGNIQMKNTLIRGAPPSSVRQQSPGLLSSGSLTTAHFFLGVLVCNGPPVFSALACTVPGPPGGIAMNHITSGSTSIWQTGEQLRKLPGQISGFVKKLPGLAKSFRGYKKL